MASLDGAKLKITRAVQHIDELERSVKAYLSSGAISIEHVEEQNGDLTFRVRFHRHIPTEWPAIVGDAVHNLRAALDYIAWQLVEQNGGTPSRATCFPLSSTQKAFESALPNALAHANPAALRFVRRLKPYTGGNKLLMELHALDIWDKHKVILVAGMRVKQAHMQTSMRVPWQERPVVFPPIALRPADTQFPLEDNDEVFRVNATTRQLSDQINHEHQIVLEPAFGSIDEVAGLPLVQTLVEMHHHVRRIGEIVDKLFFKGP